MSKPRPQYIVLSFLLVWAAIAQFSLSGLVLYLQIDAAKHVHVPFMNAPYSSRISYIPLEYRGSGIRLNDEVLMLNGQRIIGQADLDRSHFELKPGETVMFTVKRMTAGNAVTMRIPVSMRRSSNRPSTWIMVIGLFVLLPMSCLAVGFYIAFARPRDPVAWITMAMLASFGQLVGSGPIWALGSPWSQLLLVYNETLNSLWPFLMVLFALYFPVPLPVIRRHPWLSFLAGFPFLLLVSLSLYGDFRTGHRFDQMTALSNFITAARPYLFGLFSVYVFAFFFLLGCQKSRLSTADAKRRLDVMIYGCSLSLVPLFYLTLAELGWVPEPAIWVVAFCLSMLLLFPATMAYVIVVQRAMDVRMVVRSGVQYAVANTGMKILRTCIIIAVSASTVQFIRETGHRWQAIVVGGAGAAFLFVLRRLALRLSTWMDRRFFREAYNTEIILTELSNSVAGIRDTRALLETVTHRISSSLHVPRVTVLLDGSGSFRPAYALGYPDDNPPVEFQHDAATIRRLEDSAEPSRVYFDDEKSWVHETSPNEQSILQKLESQLLLPLSLKKRLLGVISLGPKLSDEPYSNADLRLLSAVASQTGLALENAQLTEGIKQEVAQRERLNRELEIAREVQERLFPQNLPQIPGLDMAGYCRPAQGVGGDYYDFIRLADGGIGIAIGDVSGKGIAAALTMASLQASLRGQTIRPWEKLSDMIQHVNRLVYDASASNRYATFFYCEYQPDSRLLRYVNAGHNAPIIYRAAAPPDAPQVLRLDQAGTVVGMFPSYPYEEFRLTLQPNDVLIAFTDGISEAMDSSEEEWEEERLLKAIQACQTRTAADMVSSILCAVDAFTAGAPQHDDMTLVVVRMR